MACRPGNVVTAMLLAIPLVSCGSPTRHSPGSAWPAEPAGFAAVTDQSWDDVTGGGWDRRSRSNDRIVTDASAPLSPANVLEYAYPSGFSGGEAPATHFYPLSKAREVFVGLHWQVNEEWQGHATSVNKLQFLYLAGSADVAMVMYGPAGGPYELRVMPQWREHTGSWLTPNVAAVPVAPGRWHRVEWHLKYESRYGAADGIIRWWLDGTLIGSYTNVRYPDDAGFVEYQLSPTWGGVGDTKRRTDWYRFDHTYISRPSGAPTAPQQSRVLVEEGFEDDRLPSRGWYDISHWGEQLFISTGQLFAGRASLEVRYPPGETGPWLRRRFPGQDRTYIRYYRKWAANWVWPPEVGPHDTYVFAMYDQQWFAPTSTYLTVYVESGYGGAPRGQRGTIGLDIARVLQSEPDRALTSLSPPPRAFELDRWYCIELLAAMNSPGGSDGRLQVWVDGEAVFDVGNLRLRDANHAALKFDSFMFGPYYHFGTPRAQSTWIDALVIATDRVGCLG